MVEWEQKSLVFFVERVVRGGILHAGEKTYIQAFYIHKKRHKVGKGLPKSCLFSLLSVNNSLVENPALKVGHPHGPFLSLP